MLRWASPRTLESSSPETPVSPARKRSNILGAATRFPRPCQPKAGTCCLHRRSGTPTVRRQPAACPGFPSCTNAVEVVDRWGLPVPSESPASVGGASATLRRPRRVVKQAVQDVVSVCSLKRLYGRLRGPAAKSFSRFVAAAAAGETHLCGPEN